jgi:peptidyl-prolyl cis-trans isomerase D
MLEQLRRSSQSLLIYVLFGIVIAVFIINFGPQSQGGASPRSAGPPTPPGGRRDGVQPRFPLCLHPGRRPQYQPRRPREFRLRERVLDELIERELLVAEAEQLGFAVSQEEVEDLLADRDTSVWEAPSRWLRPCRRTVTSTTDLRALRAVPPGHDPQGVHRAAEARAAGLPGAQPAANGGVNVSENEVKSEFERQSNQVNLEYVRYSWRRYEDAIELTPAETQAYAKANEKKLRELYDQRKFLYENAPKERKLRQILVKLDSGASADATAAAEKKAQGLAERIKKGETFATVAGPPPTTPAASCAGGTSAGAGRVPPPSAPALDEKVFAAKDGEVVGP